jgi:hypothetical protein
MIASFAFPAPCDQGRLISLALVLFWILLPAATAASPPADNAAGIVWGPWITGTSTTATVIHVRTALPGDVTVQYATDEEYRRSGTYPGQEYNNDTSAIRHIPLEGLAPGTRYHYRIWTAGGVTGDYSFLTFPESGPVTFIVYGDSRDVYPPEEQNFRHAMVADRIAEERNISFVIHTGDILTQSNNPGDWDRFFVAAGSMLANTTFVPVKGNHEEDSPLWQEIFGTGPAYSFDCGPAHIAVLDSNDNVWNRLGNETTWLNGDLENPRTWKFVALHHPLYSSDAGHPGGWLNLQNEWEPVIVSHNVSAVFQAHVHVYERDLADGVTYITEGRGGSPFYSLNATRIPAHQSSRENSLGYSRVQLDPTAGIATLSVMLVADYTDDGNTLRTRYPGETVFESVDLRGSRLQDAPAIPPEAASLRKACYLPCGFIPFSTPVSMLVSTMPVPLSGGRTA